MSILRQPQLRQILGIPHHVIPVAYLCLGYPVEFPAEPVLQAAGWRDRMELEGLMHFDGWQDNPKGGDWTEFRQALSETKDVRETFSE